MSSPEEGGRYLFLEHVTVEGKTQLRVAGGVTVRTYAEAASRFESWIKAQHGKSLNEFMLVQVLGKGKMEVEMHFVFTEDGKG